MEARQAQSRDALDAVSLLRRWHSDADADAFAAVTRRHERMVFSAAMRLVGNDRHLAQDVTQAVFIVLARRARTIRSDSSLGAWLHQTTRYAAANARRLRARRLRHETGAARESSQSVAAPPVDPRVDLLDSAIASLGADERTLIIRRYLQENEVDTVAVELGISPEAAQKRISRAVERLRQYFADRALPVSPSGVGALFSGASFRDPDVPTVGDVLRSPSRQATRISKGVLAMYLWKRLSFGFAGAIALAMVGLLVIGLPTSRADEPAVPRQSAESPVQKASPPPTTAPVQAAADEPRFAAHPSRDVFKHGAFSAMKDGIPVGWDEIGAFASGEAGIDRGNGQVLKLSGIAGEPDVVVAANLPLKPEWKWLAVTARVRGMNVRLGKEGVVAVRFILKDKDGKPVRTVADLRPPTEGTYRDWMKPQRSFEIAKDEVTLRIEAVMHNADGDFEIDDICVVPIDPEKELEWPKIKAFYKVLDAGDTEAVRKLVSEDRRYLECHDPRNDGGTPLIRSAWFYHPQMTKLLIELGADIHATDYNWKAAPIGWAGYLGRAEMTTMLIDAGADVNAKNGTGTSALGSAQFGYKSRRAGDATDEQRLETIRILKEHGAR